MPLSAASQQIFVLWGNFYYIVFEAVPCVTLRVFSLERHLIVFLISVGYGAKCLFPAHNPLLFLILASIVS